jgi:hypothetical protein
MIESSSSLSSSLLHAQHNFRILVELATFSWPMRNVTATTTI